MDNQTLRSGRDKRVPPRNGPDKWGPPRTERDKRVPPSGPDNLVPPRGGAVQCVFLITSPRELTRSQLSGCAILPLPCELRYLLYLQSATFSTSIPQINVYPLRFAVIVAVVVIIPILTRFTIHR